MSQEQKLSIAWYWAPSGVLLPSCDLKDWGIPAQQTHLTGRRHVVLGNWVAFLIFILLKMRRLIQISVTVFYHFHKSWSGLESWGGTPSIICFFKFSTWSSRFELLTYRFFKMGENHYVQEAVRFVCVAVCFHILYSKTLPTSLRGTFPAFSLFSSSSKYWIVLRS